MAFTVDPNMGFSNPGVLTEPGSDYAEEVSGALTIIGAHDHTSGKGVRVPVAGLTIDEDLPMAQNNLNQTASVRFHNYGFNLSGPDDINSISVTSGNLWFNNASGVPIQITNGASISSTVNKYIPEFINSNFTITAGDSSNYLEVSTVSGAIAINLPAASAVAAGRFYHIKDIGGASATSNITLVRTGTDTFDSVGANRILNTNLGSWQIISDGTSNWMVEYNTTKVMMDGRFGTDAQSVLVKGNTVTVQSLSTNNLIIGDVHNAVAINGDSINLGATLTTISSPTTHITSSSTTIGVTGGSVSLGSTGVGNVIANAPLTANYASFFNGNMLVDHSTDCNIKSQTMEVGLSGSDTLTVNSFSTFNYSTFFNLNVDIQQTGGTGLTVHTATPTNLLGNTLIGNSSTQTLTVNATSTFRGTTTFSNSAQFNSGLNTLFLAGPDLGPTTGHISLVGVLVGESSGPGTAVGRLVRRTVDGSSTSHTYKFSDGDFITGTPAGSGVVWTIDDSDAFSGDRMTFCNFSTTQTLTIRHSGTDFVIPKKTTIYPSWATFVFTVSSGIIPLMGG